MCNKVDSFEKQVLIRNRFYSWKGRNFENLYKKISLLGTNYIKLLLIRKGIFNSKRWANIQFLKRKVFIDVLDGNNQNIFLFGILSKKEDSLSKYLLRTLTEKDVFFDMGASYGYYSVLASFVILAGEVHGFEPNQTVFRYLKQTISIIDNPKMFCNQIAISNSLAELDFYDFGVSQSSSISTLYRETANESQDGTYSTYKVQATTLDDYVKKQQVSPTVIKVDIESGEKAFIEGGKEFLSTHKPIVILELKLNNDKDLSFSLSCVDIMKSLGYIANIIKDDGTLELLTGNYLTSNQCKNKSYENCVFLK